MNKRCRWCDSSFEDTTSNKNKICCSKVCVNKLWYSSNVSTVRQRYLRNAKSISEQGKKRRLEKRLSGSRCGTCSKPLNRNNKIGFCAACRPNSWYQDNKEHRRLYDEEYRKKNKTKINARMRERRKRDIGFSIACSLRERLKEAIKRNQKAGSAVKDLGCSIEEFKRYIEKLWQPGMTWDNWGLGEDCWQLDHKMPLHKFDLSDRCQLLEACHYSNLQPLWAKEHYVKSSKERKK